MVNINIEETVPKEDFVPVSFEDLKTYENDSVDQVNCDQYIQRVENLIDFVEEVYRILKPGGKCFLTAPYFSSSIALQDPRTKRYISEASLVFLNKSYREKEMKTLIMKADFDYVYGFVFAPDWQLRSDEARNFAMQHYNNIIFGIQFILTKKV